MFSPPPLQHHIPGLRTSALEERDVKCLATNAWVVGSLLVSRGLESNSLPVLFHDNQETPTF